MKQSKLQAKQLKSIRILHSRTTVAGLFTVSKEKNKEALADFDKAAKLAPDVPDIYLNRALSELALKQSDAALKDCNKAIDLSPGAGDAYYLRARIYREQNNIKAAEDDEKSAVKFGYKPPKTLKF